MREWQQDSYLIVRPLLKEALLVDNQKGTKAEHDQAVASVTKHNGKQEWEGDDGVQGWKKQQDVQSKL